VGVIGDSGEKLMIDTQHPNCPDNGLLCFDDWEGIFESQMHDNTTPGKVPCFLAKLHKAGLRETGSDVQVVVKFVHNYIGTYGKATHEYLYGLGLAPRLYSALDLYQGLVMVVMEYLAFQEGSGGWVELDTFEGKLGNMAGAVRKELEKIVDCLQERGMVHADLRPKNIMAKVDEQHRITISEDEPILSVIDFDLAGMVDEACYPPFLNPQVPWPTGTEDYGKVGRNDDRILLENWWDTFVQPAEPS